MVTGISRSPEEPSLWLVKGVCMPELKERKDMDPRFMWDLTSLYESDEACRKALHSLDEGLEKLAAFRGKLNTAERVHDFLVKETALTRVLNNAFNYASLRHNEDTRDSGAQSLYAEAYAKAVAADSALSFFRPELLSLDEKKLTELIHDPVLADYRFLLEDLVRFKKAYAGCRTGADSC